MKFKFLKVATVAAALLSMLTTVGATDSKPATAAMNKASAAASKKAAAAKVKPVDINKATKEELTKVPNLSPELADKIIAGRPYLSKAHLVTHNIITLADYQAINKLIEARQEPSKKPVAGKTKK